MTDISMAGTSATINFKAGGSLTVDTFSADGAPIEIPNAQIADGEKNLNGALITWSKTSVYTVSFTLVPGSDDDLALRAKLRAQTISNGHTPAEAFISSMVIHTPVTNSSLNDSTTVGKSLKDFTFYKGRLQSGPLAIGASADGKGSPSTYTFMFEGAD